MIRGRRGVLRSIGAATVALTSAFVLLGCSPGITAITVEQLTTPPGTAHAGNDRMTLAEGTGIGIKLLAFTQDPTARDANGNLPSPVDPSTIKITSDNDAIARVFHVDGATYIVTGTAPGTTKLIVNSAVTHGFVELPVQVTAQ